MRTNKELFDLTGQVALVTGGAAGIGVQMAYALAEAGANVIIAARKVERCQEMAAQLEKTLGIRAIGARVDITKPEEIDALYELIMKEFGRLDILVNNSGATWGAPSLEYPLEAWNKVINTNLTGCWLVAQKAGQIMARQGYGRIINIASAAAFGGSPAHIQDTVAYQASKAGLAGLTKDLAVKWGPHGITVNALAPGWFPSKMSQGTLDKLDSMEGANFDIASFVPVARYGMDDELKTATLFLAAPGSAYCNGVILSVDGGMVAQ